MVNIKKTALVILIITLLSSSFTQFAYAANDPYDHDALMQYDGYGKAMYESVVEQTSFITGQYTDNKDYVNDSINQIKDYANFWYDEYNDFTSSCYQSSAMNCLGEMAERGGAYVLTLGDWIKNLFNDYEAETVPSQNDYSHYGAYLEKSEANANIRPKEGYYAVVTSNKGSYTVNSGIDFTFVVIDDIYGPTIGYALSTGNYYLRSDLIYLSSPTKVREKRDADLALRGNTISSIVGFGASVGYSIAIFQNNNTPVNIDRPINNNNVSTINRYIQDNPVTVAVPQLKPRLVCPDGTTIQMSISGSTFLAVDGSVMLVNQDGTAEVNGSICKLGWEKPIVQYDPVTGQPVVIQPDGTKTDLETGETEQAPVKPPSSEDLEGCDGVLCGIGKLMDGLGSVVSSITGLVKSLLDGLVGLFVPKDLGFISEEFTRITKKLNEKIAITDSLKEAITSVFDGGGGNPLANISLNLPITNEPLSFGNVSFIEEGVPILRRVISAIVVLYTIAYVYRKITGRGGVMER